MPNVYNVLWLLVRMFNVVLSGRKSDVLARATHAGSDESAFHDESVRSFCFLTAWWSLAGTVVVVMWCSLSQRLIKYCLLRTTVNVLPIILYLVWIVIFSYCVPLLQSINQSIIHFNVRLSMLARVGRSDLQLSLHASHGAHPSTPNIIHELNNDRKKHVTHRAKPADRVTRRECCRPCIVARLSA